MGSLCSICSILRCERLEGAQYHAGNLVIVMKTAAFVFAIVGCSKLPIDMPGDYAPCVVNLGDYGIAQQQAGNLQNLMGGDILAWQPSSAVRIGPFILCRSGWHATFWSCEWRALRRIVSGWHAASMADMESALRNLLDIAGTAQLELGGGPRNPFHPLVLCCRFFGRKCVNSCCFLVGCTGLQKPIARCECFSSGCMKVGRQKANSTCPL